jgi:predicted ArsR family transcriptional regulator
MQSRLNSAERQFLEWIQQGAATVRALCDASGVTATAVRQRLARLESLGFVARRATSHGRGRPFHSYELTSQGQRQLGDNYQELAELLWEVIGGTGDPAIREKMFATLRTLMAARYGNGVTGQEVPERLQQLRDSLVEHGFHVEAVSGNQSAGLPVLREHHCPFPDLAARGSELCELEQAVFSDVLGAQVALTACCRNGDHCCEFEVQPELVS